MPEFLHHKEMHAAVDELGLGDIRQDYGCTSVRSQKRCLSAFWPPNDNPGSGSHLSDATLTQSVKRFPKQLIRVAPKIEHSHASAIFRLRVSASFEQSIKVVRVCVQGRVH